MARQTTDVPFEIETLLPDGVRYVLPVRHLGRIRVLGHILYVICAVLVLMGGHSVYSAVGQMLDPNDNGIALFRLVTLVIQLPLFLIAFALFGVARLILNGSSVITLREGVLTSSEESGPFHWSWRRNVDEIAGLAAYNAPLSVNPKTGQSGSDARLGLVHVESTTPSPMVLAPGYPYPLCAALARDLGDRLDKNVELHEEPWDFSTEAPPALLPKEPLSQPTSSDISIERIEDGVTLNIPPAGWKGAKGLLGFSLCWCGFMVVFTTLFVVAGFKDAGLDETGDLLIFVAFTGAFWLIGIAMMLGAIGMARRKAAIAVVDDSLMVLEIGLFRTKRREWNRRELESIQLGSSGTSVNNVPVMELQIRGRDAEKTGLLSSRNNEELRWIADLLTRALKLGPGAERNPHEDNSS